MSNLVYGIDRVAERVFILQPQSAEIRNFLLMLAPDKWAERLRTALPSKDLQAKEEQAIDGKAVAVKRFGEEEPVKEGWFDMLKSSTGSKVKKGARSPNEVKDKKAVDARVLADKKVQDSEKSKSAAKAILNKAGLFVDFHLCVVNQ